MERINEDTIRVIIGDDDLAERGITLLDLIGNHGQVEKFFYSILEEVDADYQFRETDSVTFQVMPSQNGLELLISKNIDFTNSSLPTNSQGINELLNSIRDTDDQNDQADYEEVDTNENSQPMPESKPEEVNALKDDDSEVDITEFDDFNDFIHLTQVLRLENGTSDLYLYHNKYYLKLTLFNQSGNYTKVSDEVAIAREYGVKTKVTNELLEEYGQLVMENSALELGRHYF